MEDLAWRVDYLTRGNEISTIGWGIVTPYKTVQGHFLYESSALLNKEWPSELLRKVTEVYQSLLTKSQGGEYVLFIEEIDSELKDQGVMYLMREFGLEGKYSWLGRMIFDYNTLIGTDISEPHLYIPEEQHDISFTLLKGKGKTQSLENKEKNRIEDSKIAWSKRRREARRTAREYGKVYLDPEQWNPELVESFLPKKPAAPFISIPPIRDRIEEIRDTITPLNEIAGMEFLHTLKLAERVSEIVYSRDF